MSDLQTFVATLQLNNYLSVTTGTVVAYDFIITFTKEIEYVWSRPWTSVSTLFVVVRYLGTLIALWEYFHTWSYIGTALILVANWAFVLFLAAADFVMILRIYAMYRTSRIVLGVLLVLYAPTILLLAISTGLNSNPDTYLSVSNPQVLDVSFCIIEYTSPSHFGAYVFIPRIILGGLMFVFAIVRFSSESWQMYKKTKLRTPNQYIKLLFRESVLYFLAHLLYNINALIAPSNGSSIGALTIITDMLSYILLFVISPRFIMSVRELYVHDTQHGWQRRTGVDTGFGIGGQSHDLEVGSIRFADGAETNALPERESEIQMVDMTTAGVS